MKTEYIVSAKTVDEAYKKAVELYSPLGDISLEEVINPGKKGFLGLFGVVPAEIRISVDDGKEDRKPKQKQGNKQQNNNNNKQQNNNNKQNNKQQNNKPQQKKEAPKAEQKKEATKVEPKKEAPKAADPVKEKEEKINVTVQEKTIAMNFLKGFIRDIEFECEVVGDLTPDANGFVPRLITIEGKDAPALIGHRGEMLDSIQYLANLCLARKSEGDHKEYVKVVIDIENYRAKRQKTLEQLANRLASKVIKTRKYVRLEPMNPYERKIIHATLQQNPQITTRSEGEEPYRRVIIELKK